MSSDSCLDWSTLERPVPPVPRRRWPLVLLIASLVALASAGGAYSWFNTGLIVRLAGHEGADADAGSNDKAVITDLLAAQQKATEDLEAIDRAVTDQQEQLKAIVSQLASLSSKVDALKSPAPEIAAVPPVSPFPDHTTAPPVSTASAAPTPKAHAPAKQKKTARVASPSGPISVGGAPLGIAPGNAH